ncbi:hypothetical protein [Baaleninema sp.]|uniref:hypothetical protein n=1 Tax=Baaleninema sp. TaxID=3101197 RepID=UPI003CFEA259
MPLNRKNVRKDSVPSKRTASQSQDALQSASPASSSSRRRRRKSSKSAKSQQRKWQLPPWQVWALLFGLGTMGTGITATALLLRLPAVPNCPSIFWPTASASMRLYCGQLAANKNNPEDLLEAIELVSSVSEDAGLRPTIDQHLELWTQDLLDLAETSFQNGKLVEAIDIARRVPTDTLPPQPRQTLERTIELRIESWKKVWAEGEDIYEAIENHLKNQRWTAAFREATNLLEVDNQYWATTKYQEITQRVQQARDDTNKLANARNLANRGDVDSILEAIALAEQIGLESPAYPVAQDALEDYGKQLLDLADAALEVRNLTEAISIARRVPASTQLKDEARDFVTLARARFLVWQPTVTNLENAIAQAQKLEVDSPLYNEAQQLIGQWRQAIDRVALLERARNTARTGSVADLTAAIAQAELVSNSTPLYDEAQEEISRWRDRLETLEDRPILRKAQELAQQGDYQSAIAQASQISRDRALYDEAQQWIYQWQSAIAEREDRPILNRAQQLANLGNLNDAIATAGQIPSSSPLYDDAQASIAQWSGRIRDRKLLDEAYNIARGGSPEALEAAIRTANGISSYGGWRSQADGAIRDWSWQILEVARDRATYDLFGAISAAERIPSFSDAYPEAQRLIADWDTELNPPPTREVAPESNELKPEESSSFDEQIPVREFGRPLD